MVFSPMNRDMDVSLDQLRDSWLWFVGAGLILLLLGILIMGSTFTVTYLSIALLGSVLFIAGIVQVIHAFTVRRWSGFLVSLLTGILLAVVGFFIFSRPFVTEAVLTMLMAVYFMGSGLFRLIQSVIMRFENWVWFAAGGAVSLILGLMIWNAWPEASLFLIGLFIGIDLIILGATWMLLGFRIHGLFPRGTV